MGGFEAVAAELRRIMEAQNAAREQALRQCRETIRTSAVAIRAVHRMEFAEAETLLRAARQCVSALHTALAAHPSLLAAGYVHDAEKEYVEAEAVHAIVRGRDVPPPAALGVGAAAYLNGLAEAGSECRRYVLDRLRAGASEEADRVLRIMDDIYYELVTFDFPDAITGNLRRTTDAFRAVLERTRGDLTVSLQQRALEQALRSAGQRLDS
ncbi:MAG TPA: hypothetical protein VLH79_14430 [Chthonomonadales bacterium]|nr:hypothetical protein [Chthonomonadales bacterium]